MGKNSIPGIGLDGWVKIPGSSGKGKGLKNKRKAKKAAAHREELRKRLAAERNARQSEYDDYEWQN